MTMLQETFILIAGGFVCAAIGYLAHSCLHCARLRRIKIETWHAAHVFYTRKAFDLMTRK